MRCCLFSGIGSARLPPTCQTPPFKKNKTVRRCNWCICLDAPVLTLDVTVLGDQTLNYVHGRLREDQLLPLQRHCQAAPHLSNREFFIDNLLVQIHFIIEMIGWTGLTLWEVDIPFTPPPSALNRCRADSPLIRPSRPESGLGFQVKVLNILSKWFLLRSEAEIACAAASIHFRAKREQL